nr:PREDICTED: probable E3 ubiquitin ligase complex SCF subunit sconB [Megachile rotundata]
MEFFRSFLRVIGLLQPAKVDFISELPPEVSQLILRKLDPESLLNVAQVSQKWLGVCRADKKLRQTARRHLRHEERQRRIEFLGEEALENPRIRVPRTRVPKEPSSRYKRIPFARYEAAVVMGRVDPRPLSSKQGKGRVAPVELRSSRCIRL